MRKPALTIGILKEAIKDLPDYYTVRGYEGEGGAWIIIENAYGKVKQSWNMEETYLYE